MEYGLLHPAGQPWLKVESKRNCYVLTVDDEEYAYYDVEGLVIGIMVHAMARVRTAFEIGRLKKELEIKSLVPKVLEFIEANQYHYTFFK